MEKILITLRGGCIESVASNFESVDICIIDWDNVDNGPTSEDDLVDWGYANDVLSNMEMERAIEEYNQEVRNNMLKEDL